MGFWDTIFAPGEAARAEELARKNRELNARRVAAGLMTPEQAAAQEARFNTPTPSEINAQVGDAFKTGAAEGLAAIPGTVRSSLNAGASWSLSFVPWWGWVIGAVVLLNYLGFNFRNALKKS